MFLLFAFSFNLAFACLGESYYLTSTTQAKLELQYLEGMKVGECRSESCDAVKIIHTASFKQFRQNSKELRASAASSLCKSLEGKPQKIFNQDRQEILICRFNDNSYAFEADLLRKWRRNKIRN